MPTFEALQLALLQAVHDCTVPPYPETPVLFLEGYERAVADLAMLLADTVIWTEFALPAHVLPRVENIRATLRQPGGPREAAAPPERAMSAGAAGAIPSHPAGPA
jgi:hypothetical protein